MSSIERATTSVSGGVAAQAEPLSVIAIARAVSRRIVNSLMGLSYWEATIYRISEYKKDCFVINLERFWGWIVGLRQGGDGGE